MNSTHEHVIREVIGRMGDEAPPAPAPEAVGVPVVTVRGPGSTARWRWLLTASVAGLVLLIGLMVWSDPSGPPVAAGDPEAVSVESFQDAMATAIAAFDAPLDVEVVEHGYVEGHLAVSTWSARTSDGDVAVVQTVDVEVREVPWWLLGDEPRSVGSRLTTTAQVIVDDVLYAASSGEDAAAWRIEEDPADGLSAFPLGVANVNFWGMMLDQVEPQHAEVTLRDLPNGGQEWRMIYEGADGTGRMEVHIRPEGHLSDIRWEGPRGEREPTDTSSPVDSGSSIYRVLTEADPLPTPDIGTQLDPAVFDLPKDFPIGFG